EAVIEFVNAAPPSEFVGYETLAAETAVVGVRALADPAAPGGGAEEAAGGDFLVKLEQSPFYPEGGGQVSDSGSIRSDDAELDVVDVYRVGDDQAVRVRGEGVALEPSLHVAA